MIIVDTAALRALIAEKARAQKALDDAGCASPDFDQLVAASCDADDAANTAIADAIVPMLDEIDRQRARPHKVELKVDVENVERVKARIAELRAERDAAKNEARDTRGEASQAWAVLTNRNWMEARAEGSAITAAVAAMDSRKTALIERANAEARVLELEGQLADLRAARAAGDDGTDKPLDEPPWDDEAADLDRYLTQMDAAVASLPGGRWDWCSLANEKGETPRTLSAMIDLVVEQLAMGDSPECFLVTTEIDGVSKIVATTGNGAASANHAAVIAGLRRAAPWLIVLVRKLRAQRDALLVERAP